MDEDFTELAFIDVLDNNTPIVHVASHFKLEPGNITNSFLLLGDGTHLTLERFSGEDFRLESVELLTLSACNTAIELGKWAGIEMEGFGVLAQKKGANSVIATLWPIADDSTGIFMANFYTMMLKKEGVTKAEALRHAQFEFIKGNISNLNLNNETEHHDSPESEDTEPPADFSHPFFWAPFILMGNWL